MQLNYVDLELERKRSLVQNNKIKRTFYVSSFVVSFFVVVLVSGGGLVVVFFVESLS